MVSMISRMPPSIRAITPADALEMERLYAQSVAYLRALGDETDFKFTAEIYLRDGFGENPAFAGIVAVIESNLVGYLLYNFGYDTDRALRYLFIIDLLVAEDWRGQGIGKVLMAEAAHICRKYQGQEMMWAVYKKNQLALDFYQGLGAEEITDLRFMSLKVSRT
jgi:ribosomal protein S18 acetylase RimI-like enzyme